MGFFGKLFGKGDRPPEPPKAASDDDGPFMEHPSGKFSTAQEAMASAFARLDSPDMRDRWIVFSGQGQGSRPDAYHIVDVRYSARTFDLGDATVDVLAALSGAGLDPASVGLEQLTDGSVKLAKATPTELAKFLNSLLTGQMGIRPFDGEDDYAVGAEWE